ncbi:MAG: SPOR domain-containing protein [Ramlibacter sp.]
MERRQLLAATAALAAWGGATAQPAQAAGSRRANAGITVEAVQMPAWTTRDGKRRPLSPGDTVSTAQEVETAANAGLVLRMAEGSIVRLGEKTRLGVQRLEVNDADGRIAVRSQLKLFDGFFRFATSAVAKVAGQREIDVSLRTATIGIRGTDFWSMTDAEHDAACLFEGNVALATRDQGALVLDKPTAFWARFFNQPVKPVGNATPDELAKFLKSTELSPGKGVAVVGGRWRVVAAAAGSDATAQALATRLREAGYPAQVRARDVAGKKVHEVRINGFATRADAAAILDRIATVDGVRGRVALSA